MYNFTLKSFVYLNLCYNYYLSFSVLSLSADRVFLSVGILSSGKTEWIPRMEG